MPMPIAKLKRTTRIPTSSNLPPTMEQSNQNENPPDETPAKITNADTLRCEVANDLDDSYQASHR